MVSGEWPLVMTKNCVATPAQGSPTSITLNASMELEAHGDPNASAGPESFIDESGCVQYNVLIRKM